MLWNAATSGDRTVVFGQIAVDTLALLREHLPEDAASLMAQGFGWGYSGNGYVTIQGPWGITIRAVDLEAEGVPDDVIDKMSGVGMSSGTHVWVRDGEGPWKVTEFEGEWIENRSHRGRRNHRRLRTGNTPLPLDIQRRSDLGRQHKTGGSPTT